MHSRLHDFLNPDSIAVIGASNNPTKRGCRAITTLLAEGYPGRIFPINPREQKIQGLACYADILTIPESIDLALICTPAQTLPAVMESCGRKDVKGAVILAVGFGETGEDGQQLQNETITIAQRYGVRVIGPNTSGIFNTHHACNLVGFENIPSGPLGILSQSGNMALSLVTEAQQHGDIGFSTYIGVGNEADIAFHEYLDYFADDENTRALVIYLEGLKQGREFLDVARKVTRTMPVVLYKSGRTQAGQTAAKSHTGTLAGDYVVSTGVMRQAGITVVERSDQILAIAKTLVLLPAPESKHVAVLADGGGHGVIAADALVEHGMKLPPLSADSREQLAALLPSNAALGNPVDVAGATDANPALFTECARIILNDPGIDSLLMVGLFGGYQLRFSKTLAEAESTTAVDLAKLVAECGKPLIVQSLYAAQHPQALAVLRQSGVPVYSSVETAVHSMAALADYGIVRRRNSELPVQQSITLSPQIAELIVACRAENRCALLETEARTLLQDGDISVPTALFVTNKEELSHAAEFENTVLAMKLVSPDILHKSDAGGVRLNLQGRDDMMYAFDDIIRNANEYHPGADIRGVLLTPMVAPGAEVILGVIRDPCYGLVCMFGLGGVFVEVLNDVVFRSLPLTAADAIEMLEEIKGHKLLQGVRGLGSIDRQALVDLMLRLSALCMAHPEIAEVDLNPVMVYPDGYAIVDARMILSDTNV